MALSCATTRYHLDAGLEGDEGFLSIEITGSLELDDEEEPAQVTLNFVAHVAFEGEDGEGRFIARGSTVVPLGGSAAPRRHGRDDAAGVGSGGNG
jgi:hypothetical protein